MTNHEIAIISFLAVFLKNQLRDNKKLLKVVKVKVLETLITVISFSQMILQCTGMSLTMCHFLP